MSGIRKEGDLKSAANMREKKKLGMAKHRGSTVYFPSHFIYRLPACIRWPTGPCKVRSHIRHHCRRMLLPEYTFTWTHTSTHFNPQTLLPARPVLPKYFFIRALYGKTDVVAPISAPMLQIVAIPREGVGGETTGSMRKSKATQFSKSQSTEKTAKPRQIRASATETKFHSREDTDYIMAGSAPNVSDRYSACDKTFLQGRRWKLHWFLQILEGMTGNPPSALSTKYIYSSEQCLCYLQWVSCPSLPPHLSLLEEPEICEKFTGLNKKPPVTEHNKKNPHLLTALGSPMPFKDTAMKL